MMDVDWNAPVILAIIAGISLAVPAVIGYWKSRPMDAAAKETADVSKHASLVEGFAAYASGLQKSLDSVNARLVECEKLKDKLEPIIPVIESIAEKVNGNGAH